MLTFKEYVLRRDETSYNPFPYGSGGLLQTAAGLGAALPGGMISAVRELTPQSSGYKAFEPSRDFLLDMAKKSPQWRDYLLHILDATENYIKTQKPTEIAGITMGNRAGLAKKMTAAFGALLKAAWVSLRDIVHTIGNIETPGIDKVGQQVQSMLHGLDTIPKDQALHRIEEFRQRLQASQGSDSIDPDARIHQPWNKWLSNV